jgi:hypothetical protein
MKEVESVLRFCKVKSDGGYANGLVTLNACVKCPDAIYGEKDCTGVYELTCRHNRNQGFFVSDKKPAGRERD